MMSTRDELSARLEDLRAEFEKGKELRADLAAQQEELHAKMLRISGGIQVLEELLAEPEPDS